MASTRNNNGLFRIPRELRNCIYEMVLLSEIEAPESPGDQYRCRPLPRLPRSNVGGLLACNHQLRQEVIDTITHVKMFGSGLQIKMDTITWRVESQVTWLLIPAPMKYIRQMMITSRISINTDWEPIFYTQDALEGGTVTVLELFMQFFDNDHSSTFGSRRSRNARSCYSLHLEKLFLNVTFMHDKSKLKPEHNDYWLRGCTADFLEVDKELFNNDLCSHIDQYMRENSLLGLTDQLVLRYDQIVTTWQLGKDPKRE